MYYTLEGYPESVAIPVGAFADPSFPAPSVSVYEERMHSWVHMPSNVEHKGVRLEVLPRASRDRQRERGLARPRPTSHRP